MKKAQRVNLAARLRQFSNLRRAGVSVETALASAVADHPTLGKRGVGGVAPESLRALVPDAMPHTRELLALASDAHHDPLVSAIADALDDPSARAAGWTVASVSAAAAALVILLFGVFVAPAMSEMFASFGGELPPLTVLALFLLNWVFVPVGSLLLLLLLTRATWTRRPQLLGRITPKIDSLLMKAPLFGHATRTLHTLRLAVWLAAGATTGDTGHHLDCLGELAGSSPFGRSVAQLDSALKRGTPLAQAMSAEDWLPGLAMVLRDAQSAGDDAAMQQQLLAYASGLDTHADALVARLTLVVQLAIGVVIGIFVVAMYLPIFKMGSLI